MQSVQKYNCYSVHCAQSFNVMFHVGLSSNVPEGVDGLFDVGICWRDAGDHQGMRVATQTVLEKPGQLGVPVRNVTCCPNFKARKSERVVLGQTDSWHLSEIGQTWHLG